MSLPVVHMDVVFLIGILVLALASGVVYERLRARRGDIRSDSEQGSSESRLFLQLMSRGDHALDNYITSIQGHLSVLGEDLPTDIERWGASRDAIDQAATQMKRHVERLRLIRMGLDENNLRLAPVNLTRLIEHILIGLEPAATEHDITLRMEVQRLTEPVSGDPQMFSEIFTTLLDNAVKHNPEGTEVVAELTERDQMALIRISDTGKGMSQDLAANIFDEGVRDRGAGAPVGSGMGLYIARMLTELHGGTIKMESQNGQGSVVSVSLPFSQSKG